MVGNVVSHYRILDKLGEGGMGVVYRAEDTKLRREVALKFLTGALSASAEDRQRLKDEAQLAASLNHPNVATIHAIEEVDGELFLVMEYLPGRTLKETIKDPSWTYVSLDRKIDIAIQITEGLRAAHKKGIVHRDVKAGNIVITPDGQAKILDFGIARTFEGVQRTSKGQTPGTIAYMSPEQARGEPLDLRSDIWSLGVVLFEIFTGQLPFGGKYEQAILYSILHERAKPARRLVPSIPEEIETIISGALEKNRTKRPQSTEEILSTLRNADPGRTTNRSREFPGPSRLLRRHRRGIVTGAVVTVITIVATIAWLTGTPGRAPASPAEINRQLSDLVERRDFATAYALAIENQGRLRGDSTFARLQHAIFDTLTVRTDPPGANVILRQLSSDGRMASGDSIVLGLTPLSNVRIGRGEYLLTARKPGYVDARRLAASFPILSVPPPPQHGIVLDLPLIDSTHSAPKMTFVRGGSYRLANWSIGRGDSVYLDDFLIDECEVSNEDYRRFVQAGGYRRREFWKHPFIRGTKIILWEKEMSLLVDRTTLPGPRDWLGQNYPEGKGTHPVTGITWYEAAAFAEYAGKSLPTLYQWEKAARNGIPNGMGIVMPWGLVQDTSGNLRSRANFETGGTAPVWEYQSGISPFGCLNMAGNVREWVFNEAPGGHITAGGSWRDPYYIFGEYGSLPGTYRADDLGFRCVRNSRASSNQGTMKIDLHPGVPHYRPTPGLTFKTLAAFYGYDRTKPREVDVAAEETADWTKKRVSFMGSDGEKIIAYLFLPKHTQPPYQCILFDPHSGVYAGVVSADWATEVLFAPHMRSGRAVFVIVPKGSLQRPWASGEQFPPLSSILYRDRVIRWARDNRIGLDYLESRGDIDMQRVAFVALSNDGAPLLFPALERRYRTVVLVACGLAPEVRKNRPETNPVNFLPRYSAPTLVLNGRYDEVFPAERCAVPLYDLLPEPRKLQLVNSGHAPPLAERVAVMNRWFDETMGAVRYER